MEKHEKILEEQTAPLKNNDDAFVKVGKDGQPVIPETGEQKEESSTNPGRDTTLDKR
ncbi:MAG: YTH domain-containing protein [Bacteroidota bacterium]|nr:YTH domain-containing protein [Bacteroidota bacterium]